MKRLLFLLVLLSMSFEIIARGLEGRWITRSRETHELEVKIYKSSDGNYYVRARKKSEAGYTTYATTTTSIDEGSNYMFGSMTMQGMMSSLGDKCRVHFYSNKGNVNSIRVDIDGISYDLMSGERPQTTNQASVSASNYNASSSNNRPNNIQVNNQQQTVPIANINATFGWAGNWAFKFTSYGTFSHHRFTTNYYNRIIEDNGVSGGTYYIVQEPSGVKRVHMRYENGLEKTGVLRYSSSKVIFSFGGKVWDEM